MTFTEQEKTEALKEVLNLIFTGENKILMSVKPMPETEKIVAALRLVREMAMGHHKKCEPMRDALQQTEEKEIK